MDPPEEDPPKLSEQLNMRLSALEKARAQQVAAQLGWSESQVGRHLLLRGLDDLERRALDLEDSLVP